MKIVLPGDEILDRPIHMENTFVENNKTYTAVLAMLHDDKLIPLEGLWYPKVGDKVVGRVEEDKFSIYEIDLNGPYSGLLISKFVKSPLLVGDIIEATVKEIDRYNTIILYKSRKLYGGKLISVKPSKIPRIIGRNNTMLKQLIEGTKCNISVGANGYIWIKGNNIHLAIKAITKIAKEAHTGGLTNRISDMLGVKNGETTTNS